MPIAPIEIRLRHRTPPLRIHARVEGVRIDPRPYAVIREARTIIAQETSHTFQISIFIQAHAYHYKPLMLVFLRKRNDHRILIATWNAPSSPKADHNALAAVFRDHTLVPG